MPWFEVEVGGPDLRRAVAALNGAGVPTIGYGGEVGGPVGTARPKRRFLRNAVLPILIVIVLAFLAQQVIEPDGDEDGPSYDHFLTTVERQPQAIERVTLETDPNEIEVLERDGTEYTSGYPPSGEQALVNTLRRQGIETVVEDGGRSSVLAWLVYILPFLLFFGFWIFLQRQMQRGGGRAGFPAGAAEPTAVKAVVDAESAEAAEATVRASLAPGFDYEVGRANRRG